MSRIDELAAGLLLPYGPHVVSESELIAYARELDPQPMHLDPASEQARQVGGLIGSGWQTAAINHAMMLETLFAPGDVVSLLAVPRLRWAAPARVGDVLHGSARLKAHRKSHSRSGHAIIEVALTLANQRSEVMLEVEERLLVKTDFAAPGDDTLRPLPPEDLPRTTDHPPLGVVEDMPVGLIIPAGHHTFEPEFAQRFALAHDPLHCLLDAAQPRVSGWHSAARWLRQLVEMFEAREAAGEFVPARGPGMGLADLIWRNPVVPGDTLHYYSRVLAGRPSASKPGWGILTLRNYAYNQCGEQVLAFTCFWLCEARVR